MWLAGWLAGGLSVSHSTGGYLSFFFFNVSFCCSANLSVRCICLFACHFITAYFLPKLVLVCACLFVCHFVRKSVSRAVIFSSHSTSLSSSYYVTPDFQKHFAFKPVIQERDRTKNHHSVRFLSAFNVLVTVLSPVPPGCRLSVGSVSTLLYGIPSLLAAF